MSKAPAVLAYNTTEFKALMAEYKNLETFDDVATWDQRAKAEVDNIMKVGAEAVTKKTQASDKLEQVKKEHAEKHFLARLVDGTGKQTALIQLIQNYDRYIKWLAGMCSQLQEAIDITPNSPEEQKNLLKELRAIKKEMQVEKREIAAEMKAIRADARSQSANAGIVAGFMFDAKLAASQRRGIRYQKEAALRPHEDAKTALERQITQIDRDILWAEKFK